MRTPDVAVDIIAQEEGFEPEPYLDVGGVLTIGFGHTRKPLPDHVTEEEARVLLQEDLSDAEQAVERLVTVPISEWQFGALVSFTFNVGQGNLARSTLLRLVNEGEFDMAAGEFRKWRRAGGEIQPGLLSRRGREEQLWRMGSV